MEFFTVVIPWKNLTLPKKYIRDPLVFWNLRFSIFLVQWKGYHNFWRKKCLATLRNSQGGLDVFKNPVFLHWFDLLVVEVGFFSTPHFLRKYTKWFFIFVEHTVKKTNLAIVIFRHSYLIEKCRLNWRVGQISFLNSPNQLCNYNGTGRLVFPIISFKQIPWKNAFNSSRSRAEFKKRYFKMRHIASRGHDLSLSTSKFQRIFHKYIKTRVQITENERINLSFSRNENLFI